jgi:hypothetical protein
VGQSTDLRKGFQPTGPPPIPPHLQPESTRRHLPSQRRTRFLTSRSPNGMSDLDVRFQEPAHATDARFKRCVRHPAFSVAMARQGKQVLQKDISKRIRRETKTSTSRNSCPSPWCVVVVTERMEGTLFTLVSGENTETNVGKLQSVGHRCTNRSEY